MGILTKVSSLFKKGIPDTGGWSVMGSPIPSFWPMDWWQKDLTPQTEQHNSAVEACVGLYGRTVAMLPINHYKHKADGGKTLITDSQAAKVLKNPNPYQTRADFMLNLVRSELLAGNGYAYALRGNGFQIEQLHLIPPNSASSYIDPNDHAIYYYVGDSELYDGELLVPSRDILNLRMQTGADLLKGESPLLSGLLAASAGTSIQKHNAAFFRNMSRPSGTLNTDLELDPSQSKDLRARWEEQSAGLNAGKTPILSHGLKWQALSMTATDAEMIEFYKMTVADIARVYGVPQALIGNMEDATLSNVETLLRQWISVGLGYMVDHIELSLGVLFDLPADESLNFDLDYLLRGNLENRMEAYSKGILGGVYSINEARAKEGMSPVDAASEPRLQMQVVPLTYYEDQLAMDKEKLELERDKVKAQTSEPPPTPTEPAVEEPEDDSKSIQLLIQKAMA